MPRATRVELPGCPAFRALCCDTLGLIKVVEAVGEAGAPKVVGRWGDPDPKRGILNMCLPQDMSPRLVVARKSKILEILHPQSGALLSNLGIPTSEQTGGQSREDSDTICGLHAMKETSIWGKAVLTCTEMGDLALQRFPKYEQEDADKVSHPLEDEEGLLIGNWSVGKTGSVLCLKVDGSERHAALGGKGIDVNLWDLEKQSRVWTGKTPHRDNLGLVSSPWVTAVTFLSEEDHRKIFVGTGHHQVRLYDVGAQRRPVFAFDFGESPIRSATQDSDGYSVFVGTGSGDLASFDMRAGKLLGIFKGKCSGSIRNVVRHPLLPLIASCGLDRYLRIHNVKSRQLLASLYLKQQLVSVVFDTNEYASLQQGFLTDTRGLDEDSALVDLDQSLKKRRVPRKSVAKRAHEDQGKNPSKTSRC